MTTEPGPPAAPGGADGAGDADGDLDVVTGAFSYSGAAITAELHARGRRVRTLTGHPERAPADTDVEVLPLDFADPDRIADGLHGAHTLYNTFWMRFAHGDADHDLAVRHSRTILHAAAEAGVRRIVHVSVLHPDPDSPWPYFRGKAQVEALLADTGIPHAIARPALLFGNGGVLVNNLAWLLRRLPVFAVGGRGDYRVRGIHVEDLARLLVDLGAGVVPPGATPTPGEGLVVDAVGPDRPTFRELVNAVRAAVHSRAVVVGLPAPVLLGLSRLVGLVLRDQLLTPGEYRTTAAGLADSDAPATGTTSMLEWVAAHGDELGHRYISEVARQY